MVADPDNSDLRLYPNKREPSVTPQSNSIPTTFLLSAPKEVFTSTSINSQYQKNTNIIIIFWFKLDLCAFQSLLRLLWWKDIQGCKHVALWAKGVRTCDVCQASCSHPAHIIVADTTSILSTWGKFYSDLLNVNQSTSHEGSEVYTAEPDIPEPSLKEVELTIEKLKKA